MKKSRFVNVKLQLELVKKYLMPVLTFSYKPGLLNGTIERRVGNAQQTMETIYT
jgi:hypothetical protein